MITFVLPCFQRKLRTRRMIKCLFQQTTADFELFLIGDGCPMFQDLVTNDNEVRYWLSKLKDRGCNLTVGNANKNHGRPTKIVEFAMVNAKFPLFSWLGNDDIILPTHVENYSRFAQNSNADITFFKVMYLGDTEDNVQVFEGSSFPIHATAVVRTELAVKGTHDERPGDDQRYLRSLQQLGTWVQVDNPITYIQDSSPGNDSRLWQ